VRIDVVTIFPDYLAPLGLSLVGKAREAGLLDLRVHDLRDWTTDRHRTVDDTPLGGGAGMVMRPDVWGTALDDVLGLDRDDAAAGDVVLLVPTPAGEVFTQRTAEDLATRERLVLACGRYEGIDARVAEHYAARGVQVREVSIGDYVLNGGEVAALVVVEAVARLLPGVLGNPDSLAEESHGASGLLEYPVYTRPVEWRGLGAPEVLLSGHHANIARWRRDRALERTAERRPDLLAALDPADLDRHDRAVLEAWRARARDEGHAADGA
jgi:tRNA (guanine37-N1)-methyltransferase